MMIQYSVGANFVLFVTNWLRNSGKMKWYPDDIWAVRLWTVIIWTVKTELGPGLGLGFLLRLELGLGLLLGLELVFGLKLALGLVMAVQFMAVQIKTGNHGTAAPTFGPCLLWPNGWMDQDAI